MRDNGDKLKEGRFQLTKELKQKIIIHHKTCPYKKKSQRGFIWSVGLAKALGNLSWIQCFSCSEQEAGPEVSWCPFNVSCSVLLWEIIMSWPLPVWNKWPGFHVSITRSSASQNNSPFLAEGVGASLCQWPQGTPAHLSTALPLLWNSKSSVHVLG